MPDLVIYLAAIVLGLIWVLFLFEAFVGDLDYRKSHLKTASIFFLACVSFVGWFAAGKMADREVIESVTKPIQTVERDDGSSFQFVELNELNKMNVTKQMGEIYPEGSVLVMTKRSPWAYGIYNLGEDWSYNVQYPGKK